VAINVAAWWLWRLMHNSIRRCGDIIDLTRDRIASRSSRRAEQSTSSPAAAVSIQPWFHHICNNVLISNNRLPRFPLTGSQQIIPVPLLIWHSCLLLLPLRQHHIWFQQWLHYWRSQVIWLNLHGQHKRFKQQVKWEMVCRWNCGARWKTREKFILTTQQKTKVRESHQWHTFCLKKVE
jgi:hypothetical protein